MSSKCIVMSLCALAFAVTPAWAGDITGKIEFQKSAAYVALLYFSDDHSLDTAEVSLDQKDKHFSDRLVVGKSGTDVVFKNSDSVSHNIFAKDTKANVDFDAGLLAPGKDAKVKVDWGQDLVVRVGCKIHPKMRSYIANVDSAHHAVVEIDKKKKVADVALAGVPDNLTKLKIWMPKYDPLEVELKPGTSAEVEIKRKGKVYGKITLSR